MTGPRVWLALAGLLALSGACGPERATGPEQVLNAAVTTETDGRYRAFADRIAAQLQAAGVPGGALGIVENGELVFATGMGVKKAGEAAPVGIDTVFRVASTTKTLTTAAIMTLAERHIVSLDAPVTRYVPELQLLPPFDPAGLTLRKLLSHTAGVPDYLELECAEGDGALAAWFAAHPEPDFVVAARTAVELLQPRLLDGRPGSGAGERPRVSRAG